MPISKEALARSAAMLAARNLAIIERRITERDLRPGLAAELWNAREAAAETQGHLDALVT